MTEHTNPNVAVIDCPICQRGEPCGDNQELVIADLKAKLEIAKEGLREYADSNNWQCFDYWCVRDHKQPCVNQDQWLRDDDGYSLAADCLKRVEGEG